MNINQKYKNQTSISRAWMWLSTEFSSSQSAFCSLYLVINLIELQESKKAEQLLMHNSDIKYI